MENNFKQLFMNMKDEITKLVKYIENRTNVHVPIKEAVAAISSACSAAEDALPEEAAPGAETAVTHTVTQTDHPSKGEGRRQKPQPNDTRMEQSTQREQVEQTDQQADPPPAAQEKQQPGWTRVERRRPREKEKKPQDSRRKRRMPTTEAIIISAHGDGQRTYAAVLRRLHQAMKDEEKPPEIKRTRRTEGGKLILTVKKDGTSAIILEALAQTAAAGEEDLTVRRLTPTRIAVVKDMDEGVLKEDVRAAIEEALGPEERKQVVIYNLRPAYGGTQRCTIRLPYTEGATELLENGRIRIGLMRCRIQDLPNNPRCYRCQETGHMAANCKGPDRSTLCRRCDKEGHKAADCKGELPSHPNKNIRRPKPPKHGACPPD